jgi:hypothetical protein
MRRAGEIPATLLLAARDLSECEPFAFVGACVPPPLDPGPRVRRRAAP